MSAEGTSEADEAMAKSAQSGGERVVEVKGDSADDLLAIGFLTSLHDN